jgi:hypothetical protein
VPLLQNISVGISCVGSSHELSQPELEQTEHASHDVHVLSPKQNCPCVAKLRESGSMYVFATRKEDETHLTAEGSCAESTPDVWKRLF